MEFESLRLNYTVNDIKDVESNMDKLTTIVAYYTRYKSIDKLLIHLSFGLENEVAVNAIIGKPTLREWRHCVDFARDIFISEELMLQFDMEYKVIDGGLPKDIIFDNTVYVRPRTMYSAGSHMVSIDRGDNSATINTESNDEAPTISYLFCHYT